MIEIDRIAKLIMEGLRPDNYDDHEEKKLKEADEVWKKVIMIIDKRRNDDGIT